MSNEVYKLLSLLAVTFNELKEGRSGLLGKHLF